MKIIIPMSGQGHRFKAAGYTTLKPLIEIDGKPIIEHVVNLYPGEKDITFICTKEHLASIPAIRPTLQKIAPYGRIVPIDSHKKGPVFAVSQMMDKLPDEEEVIVSYCDFSSYWDYDDFLNHVRTRDSDGAIPSYKGFHPHMLGTTNYAFMRDNAQWMEEIREKQPFTNNRMQEFASNGIYYFKKSQYVKKYFQMLLDKNINVNGEYYVSLVYNLMVQDGLGVSIYNVQHMLQWGTPEDVEVYKCWSDYFEKIMELKPKNHMIPKGISVVPLAGHGSRFKCEEYKTPKPLIKVGGKPMVVQATQSLPKTPNYTFICLGEVIENSDLRGHLEEFFPGCRIVRLEEVTQGQACSVEAGLKEEILDSPLLIGACDNGMLFDDQQFFELINDSHLHAVAFSFRHHPSSKRNPEMYGWLKVDNNNIIRYISVKKPISDNPFEDHAIVGTFYFKKISYFLEALEGLYRKNLRVNNEFYVDSLIGEMVELGYLVKAFEVEKYICWGTPNDLKTYEYWQSFFHKCEWHGYRLEKDPTVNPKSIETMQKEFYNFFQDY